MFDSSLQQSILKVDPKADKNSLEELINFVNKYNLKWVSSEKIGGGAFIIASQISEAKGLDSKDYVKHWSNLTSSEKGNASEPLAGKDYKLEGGNLKRFKETYKDIYGESLGRINSLIVLDWKRALSYLQQGSSDVAKEAQDLITEGYSREINNSYPISIWNSEYELQSALCFLSTFSNYPLTPEVILRDLERGSHRRADLVNRQVHRRYGNLITAYELKADIITLDHVKEALEVRRYPELLKQKYKTKNGCKIDFNFVAPLGGTPDALHHVQFFKDINIMPLELVVDDYNEKILEKYRKDGCEWVANRFKDQYPSFEKLYNPDQSSKVVSLNEYRNQKNRLTA